MGARICAATLRRLDLLSERTVVNRGGLLVVPKPMGADEWQAAAHAWHQRLLLLDAADRAQIVDLGPEPARPPASYRVIR